MQEQGPQGLWQPTGPGTGTGVDTPCPENPRTGAREPGVSVADGDPSWLRVLLTDEGRWRPGRAPAPENWPALPVRMSHLHPAQCQGLQAPTHRIRGPMNTWSGGGTPEHGAHPSLQAGGHQVPVKGQGAAQKAGHHSGAVVGGQDKHAVLCGL